MLYIIILPSVPSGKYPPLATILEQFSKLLASYHILMNGSCLDAWLPPFSVDLLFDKSAETGQYHIQLLHWH